MVPDKQTLDSLKIDRHSTQSTPSNGRIIVAFVVLVLIALAVAWWLNRPHPVAVRTAVAQSIVAGGARTLLNASGYVTARREATVSSKVTGRVLEVLVEEGMKVEAGQVLARIDATNTMASLRLADAQAQSARRATGEIESLIAQAGRTLKRTETLAASKTISEAELDLARSETDTLRARFERQRAEVLVAERQVELWQQQVDDATIRAPFSGVVTSKNAQPGEMISPMSSGGFTRTGICTIVDVTSLEVEVDVSESYINRVTSGQPVVATLDSYPDWPIPAKVIAIIPTADRQKATVRVRVGFEKLDPRILPDMSLKVAFQSADTADSAVAPSSKRSVNVPKRALQRSGDRDVVWLVNADRVERRAVTIESVRGDETTLASGLSGGETIVLDPPVELSDGARIARMPP